MKSYIWCDGCDRKIEVRGEVWNFRLSRSNQSKEHPGCYDGWVCDSCADNKEDGWEY